MTKFNRPGRPNYDDDEGELPLTPQDVKKMREACEPLAQQARVLAEAEPEGLYDSWMTEVMDPAQSPKVTHTSHLTIKSAGPGDRDALDVTLHHTWEIVEEPGSGPWSDAGSDQMTYEASLSPDGSWQVNYPLGKPPLLVV